MTLLATLDRALNAVERAQRRGLQTRGGLSAAPELGRLHAWLADVRDRVRHGERVDLEALATTIRDVAAWTPETELQLLAALGAVAQAARVPPPP